MSVLCRDPNCDAKAGGHVALAHRWRFLPSPQCFCGLDLATTEWHDLPYPEAHARHLADVLAATPTT
jgi:hypothetical protein